MRGTRRKCCFMVYSVRFSQIPTVLFCFFFPCRLKHVVQVAKAARLFKGVFYATVAAYVLDYVIGFGGILIMIFGTFVIAKSRARIGKVYNIPVDPCGNWCLSFWCGCCVAAQVRSTLFIVAGERDESVTG